MSTRHPFHLRSLPVPCLAALLGFLPLVSGGAPRGGAGPGLTAEIPIEAHINEIARYFDIADIGALRGVVSVKKRIKIEVRYRSIIKAPGCKSRHEDFIYSKVTLARDGEEDRLLFTITEADLFKDGDCRDEHVVTRDMVVPVPESGVYKVRFYTRAVRMPGSVYIEQSPTIRLWADGIIVDDASYKVNGFAKIYNEWLFEKR